MKYVYAIWDEHDGYNFTKVYADEKAAKFALRIKYTDFWITNEKAKVKAIPVFSYED